MPLYDFALGVRASRLRRVSEAFPVHRSPAITWGSSPAHAVDSTLIRNRVNIRGVVPWPALGGNLNRVSA